MDAFLNVIAYLREMNIYSLIFRLLLAMLFSGLIGIERESRRLPAGFRTYMLVCLGAALETLLSQYELILLQTQWATHTASTRATLDMSRVGAQVINGMGFIAAGTIVVSSDKQIRGIPTAASLWACACMGLAIGVGFYECVLIGFVLIYSCNKFLPSIEKKIRSHTRNVSVYVEFDNLKSIGTIIQCIKAKCVDVFNVEIGKNDDIRCNNVVLTVRIPKSVDREEFLSTLLALNCVYQAEEI